MTAGYGNDNDNDGDSHDEDVDTLTSQQRILIFSKRGQRAEE